MTAMLSAALHISTPYNLTEQMGEPHESWRHSYPSQPQMQPHHWSGGHGEAVGGMHNTNLGMFQGEEYDEAFGSEQGTVISPHLSYVNDSDWNSDYDMRSAPAFPGAPSEGYHVLPTSNPNPTLMVPHPHALAHSATQSPTSSYGSASPQQHFAKASERPHISRSHTAPERAPSGDVTKAAYASSVKNTGSEGEDEEFAPGEDGKPKGKKRQRIPHTAVERRYREALNAGIKSLQVAVAESKKATGGAKLLVDDKPSKSSILHSAIEQIQSLSRDNAALKNEVVALRARLEDIEKWCSQGGGYGKI